MDGTEKKESGPARVRRLLIQPLTDAGLEKKRHITVEAHSDMLGRIATKLAYMREVHLDGLRELLLVRAEKGRWPKEATILQCAFGLQNPPPRKSDYVVSVMVSAMGRTAVAQGYEVELLDVARRFGPPPSKYVISVMKSDADENKRKLVQVQRRIARDVASDDDHAWLSWYRGLKEECDAIFRMAEGEAVCG